MTTKLTPDQLHRLIDEVAALSDDDEVWGFELADTCIRIGCWRWWDARGRSAFYYRGAGHAGLSAVLILLSEGG